MERIEKGEFAPMEEALEAALWEDSLESLQRVLEQWRTVQLPPPLNLLLGRRFPKNFADDSEGTKFILKYYRRILDNLEFWREDFPPVLFSIYLGRTDIMTRFLDSGVWGVNDTLPGGTSLMHAAAARGLYSAVSLLSLRNADLNCRDDGGNTPLEAAVKGFADWKAGRFIRSPYDPVEPRWRETIEWLKEDIREGKETQFYERLNRGEFLEAFAYWTAYRRTVGIGRPEPHLGMHCRRLLKPLLKAIRRRASEIFQRQGPEDAYFDFVEAHIPILAEYYRAPSGRGAGAKEDYPQLIGNLLYLYRQRGKIEEGLALFADFRHLADDYCFLYHNGACLYTAAGQKAPALDLLERAKAGGYSEMAQVRVDEELESLFSEERFQKLFDTEPEGGER